MKARHISRSLFEHLASSRGESLVSLFLPTHSTGRDVSQDPIQLKNQIGRTDAELARLGWKPRDRSDRLAQARGLLDDLDFWQHQDAGLAVYVDAEGGIEAVSLSTSVEPAAMVMPMFMMRPLIADLDAVVAPVLCLTRQEVALLAVSRGGVRELDADLPSYGQVNWFVDREKQRQQHPDLTGTQRSRHGHEPSARADDDTMRFLREVDSGIESFFADTPLLVLGDDDIVARFSALSGRPTASPPNSGLRAPFSTEEVLALVLPMLAELEQLKVEDMMSEATERLGMGTATVDLDEAIPAALEGRIARVLAHRTAEPMWGRLDRSTLEVVIHEERQPPDLDLLDRLVVWSLENGADVVSTEDDLDGHPFLATLRY